RMGLAVGNRQFVIGLGFVHSLDGGLQVGPRVQSRLPELVAWRQLVVEVVGPSHVDLFNRSSVVEQRQQLDLCVFQVLLGGLQIGFILHLLQFQPVEIDLRNVAGAEASSTDIEHVVVVGKIIFFFTTHTAP